MADPSNRTFVCSVLFLDIVEYSKKSVSEQLRLKQRFNAMLVAALGPIAVDDRIVLDTGDGAAISFLGNPEDSLFVAMDLRDSIAAESLNGNQPLLVRIGINLGPVRLIKDINGQLNIIGDGINVAQRVMSFGEPGIILVSRSYYEVVSRLSDDYLQIFQDVGTRTDKHVREHSVYAVGVASAAVDWRPRQVASPRIEVAQSMNATGSSGNAKQRVRIPYLIGAPLAAIAIVGGAIATRHVHAPEERSPLQDQIIETAALKVPVVPAPKPGSQATQVASIDGSKTKNTPVQGGKKIAVKGTVELAILPWGEVYVDGRLRGISPPLKTLALAEGQHKFEIRNSAFPVHTEIIEIRAGASHKIRFKFQ